MFFRLHVTMLGRFEIWEETRHEGGEMRRALSLPATNKSQSLLAYLLLHRETPHSRDALAEMFWPGRPPQRARRSLATALWRIRRSFAPIDPLQTDHQFARITLPGDVLVDAERFQRVVAQATGVEALQEAVTLYHGDLLPGFYDDWVVRKRDWMQAQYQQALLRLMEQHEARGEHPQTLAAARQVLALDDCNEAAHRAAMRAYASMGQRAAALAQYQRCRDALAREMALPPSAETQAQYQRLLASEPAPTLAWDAAATMTPPARIIPSAAPRLVGRDDELAHLQARWREAAAGRGRMIFIRGEAGIGKTRLLAALAELVQQTRAAVISVQCYEYERGEPYGALVEVVRAAAAVGGEALIRQLSPWQTANLTRLAPELRGWLPDAAHYLVATEAKQKQLLRALTQLLTTLARGSPLLMLIDDLQWAHDSTLTWLPMLAATLDARPMLIVGAYRIEEVSPGDMLARILLKLERKNQAEYLTLNRLSVQDLAQWLPGLDENTLIRIHRHTEGNPFFVLETTRTLEEQGHLQQRDGRYHLQDGAFTPPLPDSVRQAIEIRLDALTPAARQGLAAAAVLGRVFDLDVWMGAWGQDEEMMLEILDELLRNHLLQEGRGAFTRDYSFEHHLVREAVYQTIPKRRRQQLHIAAARMLERLRGGEPGAGAEIAFHYLRAGDPQQARTWLLRAGDRAVAVAATGEALDFYQRALASYPRDEAHRFARAVLERKIGETHFRRGDYQRAEAHLLRALALLNRPMPPSGWARRRAVSAALAHQTGHRLLPGPGLASPPSTTPALREEVTAYTFLGWMYSLQSRYEEYLLVSLRALNQSEDAGYARGIAVAATALGLAADFMARFGLATRFHRRAQTVAAALDHPADAGFVAFGQAYHAYLTGDEVRMLEQAQQAATSYWRVGDAHRWSLVMALQAYVQAHQGDLAAVRRVGEELTAAGVELQDAEVRCAGESLLGLAGRWSGDWQEAAAHYRRAADLAGQIPDHMNQVENLTGLTRCLLRLERWPEARERLAQARRILIEQDVRGDAAGKFSICAFEAALWAAEHLPDARTERLDQARAAMRKARKQTRAFRPAEPEAWRLCGRYEWLRGRPDAARSWWQKSLARAQELGHRLDWGVTALEMGLRLGDETLQAAGRARLEEAGAMGAIAFLSR
jgi:DNA-binding SARP family transcriptional activator